MGLVSISIRRPGGAPQTLGATLESGVWPEDVQTQHGPGGAEQARFVLRRNPGVDWPDLLPFTPVTIYDDGAVSWTGRIQETPTQRGGSDDKLEVVCEGWQAHLSDDAHRPLYLHNDLTDWRDMRAGGANPATSTGAFTVANSDGRITIAVPNGTTATLGARGGVFFDAGPGNTIAAFTLTYFGGGLANFSLLAAASDAGSGALTDLYTIDASPIATGTTTVTTALTTPRRYVMVYMECVTATTNVVTDTAWVTIADAIVASNSSYIVANVSDLHASSVIAAQLARAPLLNQSATEITATVFDIPHLPIRVATPREFIDAVNAYHLYQVKVQDDAAGGAPRLRFRPIPTTPTLIARVGAGIEFADASRNDGGDIYNRVLVEYTDASGNDTYADRSTIDTATSAPFGASIPNPTFATNTAGWGNGTIQGTAWVRDTVTFQSSPASGSFSPALASPDVTTTSLTGLIVGRRYRVTVWLRSTLSTYVQALVTDTTGNVTWGGVSPTLTSTFTQYTFEFVAQATSGLFGLVLLFGGNVWLDSWSIATSQSTIPDRIGFTRTKILTTGSRLIAAAANQIGDVFLLAHQTSPLRGSLSVRGPAIHTLIGDAPVSPSLLGRYVGDAILITEGDPDTSAQGRVGIVAAVDHDHAAGTATIAIDSRKDFLDALLSRFSVFQGGG